MHQDTAAMLRSRNHRIGKARRRIVDAVAALDGPVTAEQLIETLPDIHPSSIYRSLGVLEELGYLRHTHLAHGPAVYELKDRVSTVRHLVCEVCGRTIQIPSSLLDPLRRRIEREHGFVLDSDHFAMAGRCSGCVRDPKG
jgi:Fur family ferric uptake transcriptional regulator